MTEDKILPSKEEYEIRYSALVFATSMAFTTNSIDMVMERARAFENFLMGLAKHGD